MDSILWAVLPLFALGVVAASIGYFSQRGKTDGDADEETVVSSSGGGCCGMHSTCERDSLLAAVSPRIVYYDDEELDRFVGTDASAYREDAVEEFRDILISLDEDDVAGWVRSLQLRGIFLPEELLPELYLVIGENRAYHMEHGPGDKH